ncbi:unnamed protein product [Gadus morhua 'NCC']
MCCPPQTETAVLLYRVFPRESKRNLKILHGSIHLLALLVSIIGLVAVFNFHRVSGSLTSTLYTAGWLMGLGFFLFPGASSWLREWYLPLHAFFGLFLLAVSIATCLTGITEKLLFSIMAPEGRCANICPASCSERKYDMALSRALLSTPGEFRTPPQPKLEEEAAWQLHFTSATNPDSP